MACNNCKCWQKSAQAAYNDAAQAYVAAGTQISILGNLVTDTGESITATSGGFRINNGGLFRISFDVTSTPTAAGAQVLHPGKGVLHGHASLMRSCQCSALLRPCCG